MNVPEIRALVTQIEAALEFDLGAVWRHLGRGPDGLPLLLVWWARGCRRLTVRLYSGCTTVEVSAPPRDRNGWARVGAEVVIGPDLDLIAVLRRGVDWLRSDAAPLEFDPRSPSPFRRDP